MIEITGETVARVLNAVAELDEDDIALLDNLTRVPLVAALSIREGNDEIPEARLVMIRKLIGLPCELVEDFTVEDEMVDAMFTGVSIETAAGSNVFEPYSDEKSV